MIIFAKPLFHTVLSILLIYSFVTNAIAAPNKEYLSSKEFLSKVSNEMNKSLPMMIDKETKCVSTYAFDKEIGYAYELVNKSSSEIDKSNFLNISTPKLKNFVCTTPHMQKFLNNGVSIGYIYYGNDSGFIGKITITPSQCGY